LIYFYSRLFLAPTDPKIGADLMANSLVYGRGNIDERTVTICSGIDFVQISHTNITGADPATAKVGKFPMRIFESSSYFSRHGLRD
jgi:hypothetical protein